MQATRQQRRALQAENRQWPEALRLIPREDWPRSAPPNVIEAWRSRAFLVQVYQERDGIVRLSVCRTTTDGRDWIADIGWEELQRLKSECGRGTMDAVEVYPAANDVVNVANMRHLWVLPDPLTFAWRQS